MPVPLPLYFEYILSLLQRWGKEASVGGEITSPGGLLEEDTSLGLKAEPYKLYIKLIKRYL